MFSILCVVALAKDISRSRLQWESPLRISCSYVVPDSEGALRISEMLLFVPTIHFAIAILCKHRSGPSLVYTGQFYDISMQRRHRMSSRVHIRSRGIYRSRDLTLTEWTREMIKPGRLDE